jgi:hypothetical protein
VQGPGNYEQDSEVFVGLTGGVANGSNTIAYKNLNSENLAKAREIDWISSDYRWKPQ